ncbi:hypothetical protein INR49_010265 [Caranx melampygus]|nr:hypothetical protein INR49_010265 [Caranx melampygus]
MSRARAFPSSLSLSAFNRNTLFPLFTSRLYRVTSSQWVRNALVHLFLSLCDRSSVSGSSVQTLGQTCFCDLPLSTRGASSLVTSSLLHRGPVALWEQPSLS